MSRSLRAGIFVLLAFVLVVEVLAVSVSAKVSDLDRIQSGPDAAWYINTRTLVAPPGDRTSFWSTVVPAKSSSYYEMLGRMLEKTGKDPRRLEYVQIMQDVNCARAEVRSSMVLFYDKLDRIMHTVNKPESARLIAEIGNAENSVLATVCSRQLAQVMGE